MLLLRLAASKQAPDAPTLISSQVDIKPKVKSQSHTTTAHKSRHRGVPTPSPEGDSSNSNNNDNNTTTANNIGASRQQPVESSTTSSSGTSLGPGLVGIGGCGNVAAARLLDLGKRLIEATREGRLEQVRQLVEDSGAPFTSDWLGTTALHVAAQLGYSDIAEILVRGGVNREARTKLERTALHLAAQSGSLEIVDLLVNHGSDVNARDMLRMTPLHWAVERGHVFAAERLLIAGADFELTNKFLLTPLDIARESGSYEMIELFKNWTGDNKDDQNLEAYAKSSGMLLGNDGSGGGLAKDILDLDYHLAFVENAANSRDDGNSMLDNEESCIDLVGLEWNPKCEFDPDLFLPHSESDDEPKVEYLMKVVEELQKENQQLRQKVEQLSTSEQ
uniref:GA-binding protein subunit beta-1 n=1 Tax=Aceria tosichella TaxID=561515 RepID=A0A6G1SII2_9ACAR